MFSRHHGPPRYLRGSLLIIALIGASLSISVFASTALAAPAISVDSGPANGSSLNANEITFFLSSDNSYNNIDFGCMLNPGPMIPCHPVAVPVCFPGGRCSQSRQYKPLSEGTYTFTAVASGCNSSCEDNANWEDSPAVTRNFTIDRTPPVLTITGGPAEGTVFKYGSPLPVFTFSASEAVTFFCGMESAATPCVSPWSPPPLTPGGHQFIVRAQDAAGNASAELKTNFTQRPQLKKCKRGRSKRAKRLRKRCLKQNAQTLKRYGF